MKTENVNLDRPKRLEKVPTGIAGFDEITRGGLPRQRSTMVSGGPGCGKTLLAVQFILNGILHYGENGTIISFEESRSDLAENFASLGYDIDALRESKRLFVNEITFDPQNVVEVGQYDLQGLFAQIEHAIDSVGARRLAIDGIETLFSYFSRERTVRMELKRMLRWIKEKEVTAVITAERGEKQSTLTRHGVEEYISDCVILLDQRIQEQVATRRLHIYKYRGAKHGTNEYPFIIDDKGLSVLPITSMGLEYDISTERVPTGIGWLDEMFDGKGYYKGSSILISGTAGTGKSSFSAFFAESVCTRGGRCLYLAFEESASQIMRNMQSIGLNLKTHVDDGRLKFHAVRPTVYGLEMHLLEINRKITEFSPDAVVIDPMSNLTAVGSLIDIKMLFIRILDRLKKDRITTFCTSLTTGGANPEATDVGISSIMDTWLLLENLKEDDTQKRSLYILKSRGMPHSSQVQPFDITGDGMVPLTEANRQQGS